MRLIRVWIACLVLALPITGCWNRNELNELGITTATGIDWDNGEWSVTFQEIVPSAMAAGAGGGTSGGGSISPVHVFSTRSQSIREAVVLNDLEHPRWIYLAHTNVVVIGLEAAKHGIDELLDVFFRNSDARQTSQLIVADRSAREILEQLVPPERLPGTALSSILYKESNFSGFFSSASVYDFALMMTSEAGAAGVPGITIVGNDTRELRSTDAMKTTAQTAKLKIDRLAVFRGVRLIGWLDGPESYGVSWLRGKIKTTTFVFPCPDARESGRHATYVSYKSAVKVTPKKAGNAFTFKVRVKSEGELMQSACLTDMTKTASIRSMEEQAEEQIERDAMTGWAALQKLHADLPGFGDKVYRKYPRDWSKIKDSWNDRLDAIRVDVHADVHIRRQGLNFNSFERISK